MLKMAKFPRIAIGGKMAKFNMFRVAEFPRFPRSRPPLGGPDPPDRQNGQKWPKMAKMAQNPDFPGPPPLFNDRAQKTPENHEFESFVRPPGPILGGCKKVPGTTRLWGKNGGDRDFGEGRRGVGRSPWPQRPKLPPTKYQAAQLSVNCRELVQAKELTGLRLRGHPNS